VLLLLRPLTVAAPTQPACTPSSPPELEVDAEPEPEPEEPEEPHEEAEEQEEEEAAAEFALLVAAAPTIAAAATLAWCWYMDLMSESEGQELSSGVELAASTLCNCFSCFRYLARLFWNQT